MAIRIRGPRNPLPEDLTDLYIADGDCPTNMDVIMGRGALGNNHEGNKRYWRQGVLPNRPAYKQLGDNEKAKKHAIARAIYEYILSTGGRFLHFEEDTNKWFNSTEKKVLAKIKQALRDKIPKSFLSLKIPPPPIISGVTEEDKNEFLDCWKKPNKDFSSTQGLDFLKTNSKNDFIRTKSLEDLDSIFGQASFRNFDTPKFDIPKSSLQRAKSLDSMELFVHLMSLPSYNNFDDDHFNRSPAQDENAKKSSLDHLMRGGLIPTADNIMSGANTSAFIASKSLQALLQHEMESAIPSPKGSFAAAVFVLLQYPIATFAMTTQPANASEGSTSARVSLSSQLAEDDSIIRWGIVGLGDVVQIKSGPAFFKNQNSRLVAVMRRTPGKAQEYAEKTVNSYIGNDKHIERCVGYDNLEDFLKHPNIDAVYVSTRPGSHLEICKQVAAAGLACYVEKPVGRCTAETQAIVDMFEKAGLPLYTAYISRAYERTQAVKQLLAADGSSPLGDRVTKVSYRLVGTGGARDMGGVLPWRLDAEQSGGGLIMDVGCHVLDRIDYLCGPLVDIKGEAQNKNSPNQKVEDYVHLVASIGETIDRPSMQQSINAVGAKVECTWDFASPDQEPGDQLVLEGPSGSLRMIGMSPNAPIDVYDSDGNLQRRIPEFAMPEHTAQALIQAVTMDLVHMRQVQQTKQLKGMKADAYEKPDFLSFGDNAIRVQKVIDALLESHYSGREIGYWSRWKGEGK
ncbi:MAG: hypothetical protein SGBAC_007603 [Bacillariaceae sp.]